MTEIVRATAGNLEEAATWQADESNGGIFKMLSKKEHGAHNTIRLRSKNGNHISPDSECAQCKVKIYKKNGKDVKRG